MQKLERKYSPHLLRSLFLGESTEVYKGNNLINNDQIQNHSKVISLKEFNHLIQVCIPVF